MTLWRLEWLRLVRTRRLVVVLGVYAFFGVFGPVSARYLADILDRVGGEVQIEVPPPVPADGLQQYNLNAQQIGILVAVITAAGALSLDAVPEMSVFLRTRVADAARLLVPRAVTAFAAIAGAYVSGVVIAGYQTWALLGPLPWGGVAVGAALGVAYLAFVVAVTAAAASRTSSVLATVAATVVTLLGLPLLGVLDPVAPWLPSHLVGALDALARDGERGDYVRALAVTVVATAGLLAVAAAGLRRREL